MHPDAPALERRGDKVGGALLFVGEFGVGMDFPAYCLDFGLPAKEWFEKLHRLNLGDATRLLSTNFPDIRE